MITKTLKVRIRDRHAGFLRQGAREVNFAWNFCNDLSYRCLQREQRFLSGYDLQKYTCSSCKKRTGPKGLEGLRIREWSCVECGSTHDRDVNAANNILAVGLDRLAGEKSNIPILLDYKQSLY